MSHTEQADAPALARLLHDATFLGIRLAIQGHMGMFLASVLVEQPTRFRPTALFGFGTGEELLDDAGDLLGIHMLQHITVGRHTRKARTW
jgi:hypothetical protein